MKIDKKNNLVLDDLLEITSLEMMLKDLPDYLKIHEVKLSAISETNRKKILELIKVIYENMNLKSSEKTVEVNKDD